jgi:hypothetical protein
MVEVDIFLRDSEKALWTVHMIQIGKWHIAAGLYSHLRIGCGITDVRKRKGQRYGQKDKVGLYSKDREWKVIDSE